MELTDRRLTGIRAFSDPLPLLAFLLAALALMASITLTVAQDSSAKPNFTGRWEFERIDQPKYGPEIGTEYRFLEIKHREPNLKVTLVRDEGSSVRLVTAHTTDGLQNVNRSAEGQEVKSKTFWQDQALITDWTNSVNGSPVNHRQTWSLSADGKRLIMAMRDGDLESSATAVRK